MSSPSPSPGHPGLARKLACQANLLALAACCGLPALAAQADLGHGSEGWGHFFDVTNPYVSLEYANDSNVLRLDDITPAVDGRGDQIGTLGMGFASDVRSGSQRFKADGELDLYRYNHHSEYNYTGGNFAAVWHWTGSDTLTGTAGYRFRRSLRDFTSEESPKRPFDVGTVNRVFGTADLDLPGHWRAGLSGDVADIRYTATPSLNQKKYFLGTSMTYVSTAANELGLDLQGVHGDYGNASGSNYDQFSIGPTLTWKYTVRTKLTATVDYTRRNYSSNVRPDYSGPTANIALTIADAGRGTLTATAYRDISNLTDEIPDYAVIDGVSLEPGWTLSNGMSVRLHGSYEHRDFRNAAGVTARLDDIGTISGFIDWPIGRHFKLTGGVTTERRSSTRLYQDYEFLRQQIQFTGTF